MQKDTLEKYMNGEPLEDRTTRIVVCDPRRILRQSLAAWLHAQPALEVAATVSSINACKFCNLSHSAAARELAADQDWINDALEDPEAASISPKMKALLVIASHVTASGKSVTADDVQKARQCGATDREIHDTVLIAATFNLFNRYVDGLATFTPTDPGVYEQMGKRMANGYVLPQKN